MEKKNNIFGTILKSCTDFKFYKEIFYQPFGITLRYLLCLVLILTVILGIRYSLLFNQLVNKGLEWVEESIPYIEINDGVVSADVEQPFTIEDEKFILIIDTTDQIKEINYKYDSGILLTKNKVIVKQDRARTQEFDLSGIKKLRLDIETLNRWKKYFVLIIIPIMIVVQFVYFAIAKMLQILTFGLAILIFKPQLKFNNVLNLCAYALAPPTILAVVVALIITKPLFFFPFIYLGMYVAFIVGGLKQIQAQ